MTQTDPKHSGRDRSNNQDRAPIPASYGGNTILIGFDTEYQCRGDHNDVLSYQFYACNQAGENEWRGIYYPDRKRRVKLAWFIEFAVTEGLKQQTIKRWPKRVYLIGHFSLADLTTFDDFEKYKSEFDAIRRTYITITQETSITAWDVDRHKHKISLALRDSLLLAPAGKQALKELGKLVNVQKLELKDGEIENMEVLLATNPARFEEYALRDPEVAVRYCLKILALNRDLLGVNEIPPTLSSIGVNYLLQIWEQNKIDKHRVLGTEVITVEEWVPSRGHTIKRRITVPTADRYCHESLAIETFHGGRNEQYFFGPSTEGVWTDYDLCGAYSSALAIIGMPAWSGLRPTRDISEFQPHVLGYARIRFRFPDNTRFPCLPMRTATGLIFPLEGETFCCSPEIYLAQSMGAQVEIVHGVVLPADFSMRPFEQFILECTRRRKSFPKRSLEELFWKELSNATYGKTAQGLRRKRVFNTRSAEYQDMPESKITNPYFASFTTSFIRAAVGEILARLPLHIQVSNITTDGFLSTATEEEALAASQGPICRLFAQARHRICGKIEVLEAKHQVQQVLGWRTRGQATIKPIEGKAIVLAKGGLKAPMKNELEQNAWILDLFANRTQNTTQTLKLLRTLPDIYREGGDLVPREVIRRVSMEFDWKRRPVNPTTRSIGKHPHLYFDTLPWRTVGEYQQCRDARDRFANIHGGVFKTESDLEAFNDYRSMAVAPGIRRSLRETSLAMAKRMFLRAYVRSEWGMNAQTMSYSELAQWLTALGYSTKKSDIENAKRPSAKLVAQLVPGTPAVGTFVERIRERFPAFDCSKLLTSG